MSALPWVGRELYEKKESELDRMLGSLEGYIKRRSKTHHAALRVFHSDNPHPQEEYLDSLWQQIKRLRSEMWIEKHIIRPYLAFDSVLCEALQHNLPPMVPPPHHPSTSYPLPQVVFRMFDYTDCPEVNPKKFNCKPDLKLLFLKIQIIFHFYRDQFCLACIRLKDI